MNKLCQVFIKCPNFKKLYPDFKIIIKIKLDICFKIIKIQNLIVINKSNLFKANN